MKYLTKKSHKELLEKVDLEEVFSQISKFDTYGTYLTVARCPFHTQKSFETPFVIANDKYYCFECGASGNTIDFMMTYRLLTFEEAIKFLADRYDVKLKFTTRKPTNIKLNEKLKKMEFKLKKLTNKWIKEKKQ